MGLAAPPCRQATPCPPPPIRARRRKRADPPHGARVTTADSGEATSGHYLAGASRPAAGDPALTGPVAGSAFVTGSAFVASNDPTTTTHTAATPDRPDKRLATGGATGDPATRLTRLAAKATPATHHRDLSVPTPATPRNGKNDIGQPLQARTGRRRDSVPTHLRGAFGLPSTTMTVEESALLSSTWPRLTAQLADALSDAGEGGLVSQVGNLRVMARCDCDDNFCQSFYTQPPPDGAYGPGHRNINLSPNWPGMLVLDVVDDLIMFVEVIDRPPLD